MIAGAQPRIGDLVDGEIEERHADAEEGERGAGGEDVPPGADREGRGLLRVVEHAAPGDRAGIPEAEKFQRRLGDDGEDDAADEIDADDRYHVGEDLECHDAPLRLAHHLGGFDEVLVLDGKRLGAGDAGAPGPGGRAEDQRDDDGACLADEGGEHQQQRQVGNDQHHVGEEADDLVGLAAAIAGDDAERGAGERDQQAGAETDGERGAGAIDQPGEDILADAGGAENMVERRRLMRPAGAGGGIVMRQQRRGDRDDDDDGDDDEAGERLAVSKQGLHLMLPSAAGRAGYN